MAGHVKKRAYAGCVQVEAYLQACFGPSRLAATSQALARPSLRPTLRVNTLRTSTADVCEALRSALPGTAAAPHPHLPATVVLQGRGPLPVDYSGAGPFFSRWGPASCSCYHRGPTFIPVPHVAHVQARGPAAALWHMCPMPHAPAMSRRGA